MGTHWSTSANRFWWMRAARTIVGSEETCQYFSILRLERAPYLKLRFFFRCGWSLGVPRRTAPNGCPLYAIVVRSVYVWAEQCAFSGANLFLLEVHPLWALVEGALASRFW